MILQAKEYQIIIDSLREVYKKEENVEHLILIDLLIMFNSLYACEDSPVKNDILKKTIEKNDTNNLPHIKTGYKEGKNYNGSTYKKLPNYFYELNKKIFNILQNSFAKNNIDFIHNIQQDALNFIEARKTNGNLGYGDANLFSQYIAQYISQITAQKYDVNKNASTKEVYYKTLDLVSKINQKDKHFPALTLIKHCIENEKNQTISLNYLKKFIQENKTIGATGQKTFDEIKELIKDWDLSTYFSLAEKKQMYSSQDGIASRKVEGLFYCLDLNTIKANYKNTIGVMGENLRTFVELLPEIMGNMNDYVGLTKNFQDPYIELNILFEQNPKQEYIDAINGLMSHLLKSKTRFGKNELKSLMQNTLLAINLDETLEEREEKKPRNKI